MAKRDRERKKSAEPRRGEPGTLKLQWKLLLVVVLVWIATTDDRHVGIIADGRQMIWTAVAITENASLGQARGRDFTFPRPAGDAVSRYGMGMSLAQVPAAALAPAVEERFGRGSSQPLFLIAPLLFNLIAAAASASAVRHIGGSLTAQRVALVLTALGSPLAAYAELEFSEPMQAAALAVAFAASVGTAVAVSRRDSSRFAAVAGLAAGIAVLTKSSLLIVAPFALLPLLAPASISLARRLSLAAVGALPVLALWLWFEVIRFGKPFASYGGERFSHPLLDGLWRLTVGPDKGLLWYFPAVLLAAVCVWRLIRQRTPREYAIAAGVALPSLALLFLSAAWWAWHGAEGWGPRLLVPAIPLLAAAAALVVDRWRPPLRNGFVAVSIALNVLPMLQHPTPIATFTNICTWPVASAAEAARLPAYARLEAPDGTTRVAPDGVLATVPQASHFLVYPWFLRATWVASEVAFADALRRPPWIAARPDIRPQLDPLPAALVLSRSHGRFWGRGFFPTEAEADYAAVYDEGLQDQVIRAQQLLERGDALRLAEKLERIVPSGDSVALLLESYRLLHMKDEARAFLGSVPPGRRTDPKINVVLALFERDEGNEESARRFLENAAASLPGSPAARAVGLPMRDWPSSLAAMTASRVDVVATQ